MEMKLPIVEYFSTYQGEGKHIGKRCFLVRFKYCNLKCPFCDTQPRTKQFPIVNLSYMAISSGMLENNNYLLITGGEPTLPLYLNYMDGLFDFLNDMNKGATITIETNGFKLQRLLYIVSKYNDLNFDVQWSPKLLLDNTQEEVRFKSNLNSLQNTVKNSHISLSLKLVVTNDLKVEKVLKEAISAGFPNKDIYLMPEGETVSDIVKNSEQTVSLATKYKVCLTTRLHILYSFT